MLIPEPWKALFFSFPFVFLKESPLVTFSLSYPYCPQASPTPYLALASKVLSLLYSGIWPTYSALILEKNFFGPLLLLSWKFVSVLTWFLNSFTCGFCASTLNSTFWIYADFLRVLIGYYFFDVFSGVADFFVFLSSNSNSSSEFKYEVSTGPFSFACFFYFLTSFFCFFGWGVYYYDSSSEDVYFLTSFLLFFFFLGITTSAYFGTSTSSSFKSSNLFGWANWLIIQPRGC